VLLVKEKIMIEYIIKAIHKNDQIQMLKQTVEHTKYLSKL